MPSWLKRKCLAMTQPFLHTWKARMHFPATFRPPPFMQRESSILHFAGARRAERAAPRARPEDLRGLRLLAMTEGYRSSGAERNFDLRPSGRVA